MTKTVKTPGGRIRLTAETAAAKKKAPAKKAATKAKAPAKAKKPAAKKPAAEKARFKAASHKRATNMVDVLVRQKHTLTQIVKIIGDEWGVLAKNRIKKPSREALIAWVAEELEALEGPNGIKLQKDSHKVAVTKTMPKKASAKKAKAEPVADDYAAQVKALNIKDLRYVAQRVIGAKAKTLSATDMRKALLEPKNREALQAHMETNPAVEVPAENVKEAERKATLTDKFTKPAETKPEAPKAKLEDLIDPDSDYNKEQDKERIKKRQELMDNERRAYAQDAVNTHYESHASLAAMGKHYADKLGVAPPAAKDIKSVHSMTEWLYSNISHMSLSDAATALQAEVGSIDPTADQSERGLSIGLHNMASSALLPSSVLGKHGVGTERIKDAVRAVYKDTMNDPDVPENIKQHLRGSHGYKQAHHDYLMGVSSAETTKAFDPTTYKSLQVVHRTAAKGAYDGMRELFKDHTPEQIAAVAKAQHIAFELKPDMTFDEAIHEVADKTKARIEHRAKAAS